MYVCVIVGFDILLWEKFVCRFKKVLRILNYVSGDFAKVELRSDDF